MLSLKIKKLTSILKNPEKSFKMTVGWGLGSEDGGKCGGLSVSSFLEAKFVVLVEVRGLAAIKI